MNDTFSTTAPSRSICALRLAGVLCGLLAVLALPGSVADHSAATRHVGLEPVVLAPQPAELDHNGIPALYALLSQCPARLKERERWEIAAAIDKEARHWGYDPVFVLAMVEVESGCSPRARGTHGSLGLLQMIPDTADAMAREANLPELEAASLTRPVLSLHLGLRYLAQLERDFGDPHVALAAYNMGPGRVAQIGRKRARNARYVQKILERYEELLAGEVAA